MPSRGQRPRLQLDNAHRVAKVERVRQFLEFIIRQLVEFPDEVMLSEIPSGRLTVFRLQMRQTDVGRIIGRNGQTIRAIRALLSSAAARHGQKATLDIMSRHACTFFRLLLSLLLLIFREVLEEGISAI